MRRWGRRLSTCDPIVASPLVFYACGRNPVEVSTIRVLRGPNIWATFPVLEATIHLGRLSDSSSHSIPGFLKRLTAWLPTLSEQLRAETNPAEVLMRVA